MKVVHLRSPSGSREFFCDPAAAIAVRDFYRRERNIVRLDERLVDGMTIDFGGMVMVGETEASFTAAGVNFTIRIRQFTDVLERFRDLHESELVRRCVCVGNWIGFFYTLSLPVRDALVREMERLLPEIQLRANAEWKKLSASTGRADSLHDA